MNARSPLMFVLLAGFQAGMAGAEEPSPSPLTVTAKTPVVSVERRPPGRYFLSLPALEYAFAVETRCPGTATPASLSISIADSRTTLTGSELEGAALREIVLTVPARQIPPVAVNGFCVLHDVETVNGDAVIQSNYASTAVAAAADQQTLDAALSAQLSLRCKSAGEQSITYVTRPLDITLACEVPVSESAVPEQRGTADQ